MRVIVALAFALGLIAAAAPALAQDAEALRREMELMRKQFEAMQEQYKKAMDTMTERLERVEARPQPSAAAPAPPATPPPAPMQPGQGAPPGTEVVTQRPPGSDPTPDGPALRHPAQDGPDAQPVRLPQSDPCARLALHRQSQRAPAVLRQGGTGRVRLRGDVGAALALLSRAAGRSVQWRERRGLRPRPDLEPAGDGTGADLPRLRRMGRHPARLLDRLRADAPAEEQQHPRLRRQVQVHAGGVAARRLHPARRIPPLLPRSRRHQSGGDRPDSPA